MTTGNKKKRIDEELVCADALLHCLRHQHGCSQIGIEREKKDPPDFWITVDGIRFAGEVTSIVIGQGLHSSCEKLKEEIKHAAQQQKALVGTYALVVTSQPVLPKRTLKEYRDLVRNATSFIQVTQSVASTEETTLLKDDNGHLRINKLSAQGATVGIIGIDSKWGGEFQTELRQIMQEAIGNKRGKLAMIHECHRIILLLYDAYGYAETKDAQKALLRTEGYDWFHSIFWAASFTDRPNQLCSGEPGREGTFLYSEEEAWWKNPTNG